MKLLTAATRLRRRQMEDLLPDLLDDMVETDTTARCIITLKAFMSELKDIHHYKPKAKLKSPPNCWKHRKKPKRIWDSVL